MSTIQALVQSSHVAPIDTSGLRETYDRLISRSRKERDKLQRELAIAGDGAVLNVFDMFKLPEAYTAERWPQVAMAPMSASEIRFTYHEYRWSGFHTKPSADKPLLSVSPPARPVRTPQEQQEQQEEYRSSISMMSFAFMGGGISSQYDQTGSIKVPMVPKSLVPYWSVNRFKETCWVLFDSPVWKPEALPADPYLLERLDDKRFKILAHWDLTNKERQLMALIRE